MMKQLANLRKSNAAAGDDVTFSRWIKEPNRHSKPSTTKPMPADATGTRFKTRIMPPSPSLLVSGHSNIKIGRDVRSGRMFRGYWIYTLSLEERATCPASCQHWRDCYGNSMPFAKRTDHSDHEALCAAIEGNLASLLAVRGRIGILIRLHALGDFYSVPYVRFWSAMLALHDRLAIFGYTARSPNSEIGREIAVVKQVYGRRFAVRWSDGGLDRDCTVSAPSAADVPPDAFACPEQTGAVDACGKCGACWAGDKNVAFVAH